MKYRLGSKFGGLTDVFISVESKAQQVSLKYTHATASVVRPSTMFEHFLQNRLDKPSQFGVEPLRVGGTKVCSRHLGHMTMMAATPIYSKKKTFKHFLLQNRQADFHEIWYVASRTRTHHSLFK